MADEQSNPTTIGGRPIRMTAGEVSGAAWAGAHAAMRHVEEAIGFPLRDRNRFTAALTALYEANHETIANQVQVVPGVEAKAA